MTPQAVLLPRRLLHSALLLSPHYTRAGTLVHKPSANYTMVDSPRCLSAAHFIVDTNQVTYPAHINGPRIKLNINALPSKFRYDRDFLLQFMDVCKDKPDRLPPPEAFSLDALSLANKPGSAHQRQPVCTIRVARVKEVRMPNPSPRADTVAIVEVRVLLNTLTPDDFDSVSGLIITWVNSSEGEDDAWTLFEFIRLVFERAISEPTSSQLYARLCRKMMDQASPAIVHKDVRDSEGHFITGSRLFRKLLLNRCQEHFEHSWRIHLEASAATAANTAIVIEVPRSEGREDDQKAIRQGPDLMRFMGELFKLQMLTERIMHECVKKLLSNIDNPGNEVIESLCALLEIVGQKLDTTKARTHMDVYIRRMKDLSDSSNIDPRLRSMLLEAIELRSRNWIPRDIVATPDTTLPSE